MGLNLKQDIIKLGMILKECSKNEDICDDFLKEICEILKADVLVTDIDGSVLYELNNDMPSLITKNELTGEKKFEIQIVNQLESVNENKINISLDNLYVHNIDKELLRHSYGLFLPIFIYKEKLGMIIIYRKDKKFDEKIDILCEYISSVLSILIWNKLNLKNSEKQRKKQNVKACISALSYSELEAILNVFNELDCGEGLLIASKIADKAGITRSVIVNALRKFESAGVIETRSLGMKGTHIKVLNEYLLPEIEKFKN